MNTYGVATKALLQGAGVVGGTIILALAISGLLTGLAFHGNVPRAVVRELYMFIFYVIYYSLLGRYWVDLYIIRKQQKRVRRLIVVTGVVVITLCFVYPGTAPVSLFVYISVTSLFIYQHSVIVSRAGRKLLMKDHPKG